MHSIDKSFSADFKAKVALAALKGDKTEMELEKEFAISSAYINRWKQHLLNNINFIFEHEDFSLHATDTNHAKIGEIIAENDFLTKVLGR